MRDIFELHPHIRFLISATVRNEETLACFLEACGRLDRSSGLLVLTIETEQNKFGVTDLNTVIPPLEEQTGFFLVSTSPIRIFEIISSRPICDVFGL